MPIQQIAVFLKDLHTNQVSLKKNPSTQKMSPLRNLKGFIHNAKADAHAIVSYKYQVKDCLLIQVQMRCKFYAFAAEDTQIGKQLISLLTPTDCIMLKSSMK